MKKLAIASLFAAFAAPSFAVDSSCANLGDRIEESRSFNGGVYRVCALPSRILSNLPTPITYPNIIAGKRILWALNGVVLVGNGESANATFNSVNKTTVRFTAGAQIVGETEQSALVVTRGAQLIAQGSPNNPVVFSSADDNFDGAPQNVDGEWGGVALAGFGVSNECNNQAGTGNVCVMEGISSDIHFGGGSNTTHSSGNLQYVVIAESGHGITDGDELNGLTLYATNASTSLNNVHVHSGSDDGIEFFGGKTSANNLILTCNQDDSIDWDHGFQGSINGAYIEQKNQADHAFELAGNPANKVQGTRLVQPLSNASVSNVTVKYVGAAGGKTDTVFRVKEGSVATFNNVVVENSTATCESIDSNAKANFSRVKYNCANSGKMPASDRNATGFQARVFWRDYPGCK